MAYTQAAITIKDGASASKVMNAYSDGTNLNFVHGLIDGTGALITTSNGLPNNLVQVGGTAFALGQQLAAASLPVVLTAAQMTTLTPLTTLPTVTTVGAVTAITNALPAGTNTIGTVNTVSPIPVINTSSTYAHTAVTTAYAFGQLWANNTAAGSVTFPTITVAKATNQACTILGGYLSKSGNVTTNAIFRIHLFTVAPTTAVADRGTFQGQLIMANWIGSFDCNVNQGGSDVSIGALVPTAGSLVATIPTSGAQTLVWVPEVRGAYTPISSETLTLTLWTQ